MRSRLVHLLSIYYLIVSARAFAPLNHVTHKDASCQVSASSHAAAFKRTTREPIRPIFMAIDSPEPKIDIHEETTRTSLLFGIDPGTKGGVVILGLVLFVVPMVVYNVAITAFGWEEVDAGVAIGVGYTSLCLVAWTSTLLMRVLNKDMTYAKQLKDYENAVLAKRLEELDEEEVQALVEQVERDVF